MDELLYRIFVILWIIITFLLMLIYGIDIEELGELIILTVVIFCGKLKGIVWKI